MYTVMIVAAQGDANADLLKTLEAEGIGYAVVAGVEAMSHSEDEAAAVDAVVLDLSVRADDAMSPVVERCQALQIPLLCCVPAERLAEYDASWGASDFFLLPPLAGEVTARIAQAQRQNHKSAGDKVLQAGDLRIDLDSYEVFNRGRRVLLTFKEYQLLCMLTANPGRVFTREALLNQIWEYDYFGGTRTVDVHIRRLRSKIEDTGHVYIETVRNVGYRFRPQGALPRRA